MACTPIGNCLTAVGTRTVGEAGLVRRSVCWVGRYVWDRAATAASAMMSIASTGLVTVTVVVWS